GFDDWQRQAIFRIDPEQTRWYSDPLPGTEQLDLRLASGDRVHAWYLPASGATADTPTVLYLHGARWNLNNSVFRLRRWHELGFNVLAIDYRGFGRSTALLPSEDTAFEDVLAGFDELKRRQPDPGKRFVYGHSLGGALAVRLAADKRSQSRELAGVVLESSFTSIADLVATMRWGWVPGISLLVTQPFDSARRIAQVEVPLLLIHGTGDNLVPHQMSDRLYEAARAVPGGLKRVLKIDGASHSGVSRAGGRDYEQAVREFVEAAGALMRKEQAGGAMMPR
ncbi:MAG: alpha/beta hydrolase, partial [Gammaproteobacteria bacterium]